MPHITSLRLSHFRSHIQTTIEADMRPVAIWGANGAGKTNILEAISLLSPGRGLRRATADELGRRPDDLGWRVRADITADADHRIVTGATGGDPRTVRIDDKATSQAALGRLLRVVWLVPVMDRLWLEGAADRRRFLDRMTLSFDPEHGDTVLRYEKAMRERNRLLRDQITDPSWYAALEQQMGDAAVRVTAARRDTIARLAQAQGDATTAFPSSTLSLTGPDGLPEDSDEMTARLADHRRRDLAAGRSLIGPHRADLTALYAAKGVPARNCSTGEQKALLISLVLANARALSADGKGTPVLLLDEVAAHLDPSRRGALYAEIVELGIQAWMTGTDATLFSELNNHALNLEVTDSDGHSIIRRH